jgi:putative protease
MSLELLAPAGDFECLKAAVSQGCDAVYLGAKAFSARSAAANFSKPEFQDAADYCHLRGAKIYVAVNTLCKDKELVDALLLVKDLAEAGADAFITQDLGLAALIRKSWPDLALHASTQMAAQSAPDVRFLASRGFTRVILAREMSLADIKAASEFAEVEVFVHGALCVCYSGLCLMSSLLGGRSGNRGKCAQPCRLKYRLEKDGEEKASGCLLSPKDLCALPKIGDIATAGATSVKIEGRMRAPAYVAATVRAYRTAIDNPSASTSELEKELLGIFNRGGAFTQGYLSQHAGADMMAKDHAGNFGVKAGTLQSASKAGFMVKALEAVSPGDGLEVRSGQGESPGGFSSKKAAPGEVFPLRADGYARPGTPVYKTYDKTLNDKILSRVKDTRKLAATGFFEAQSGQPARLRLQYGESSALKTSEPLERAKAKPSSRLEVMERLSKTGNDPFSIKWASFEMNEDFFLPASVANNLRREACAALKEIVLKSFKRDLPAPAKAPSLAPRTGKPSLTASVQSAALASAALQDGVDRLVIPLSEALRLSAINELDELKRLCASHGAQLHCALPPQISDSEAKTVSQSVLDGFYCSSWGQLDLFKDCGKALVAGFQLRTANLAAQASLLERCQGVTLSPELSASDLAAAASAEAELIAYGRLPLMETRQCPIGNYVGKRGQKFCSLKDKEKDSCVLIDRKSIRFPLLPDCGRCVCQIMNQSPQDWSRKAKEILSLPAGRLLLLFTLETREEIERIASNWSKALKGKPFDPGDAPFTYGLLYRGVE